MRQYDVYILTNKSRTLYTGVTNDMLRRLQEHRDGRASAFTSRYRITKLVDIEGTPEVRAAIAREKQIKSWRREKKIALIESMNPAWEDLSERWGEDLAHLELRMREHVFIGRLR